MSQQCQRFAEAQRYQGSHENVFCKSRTFVQRWWFSNFLKRLEGELIRDLLLFAPLCSRCNWTGGQPQTRAATLKKVLEQIWIGGESIGWRFPGITVPNLDASNIFQPASEECRDKYLIINRISGDGQKVHFRDWWRWLSANILC